MIALLGGTFDPIHNGHIHIATAVWQHFKCSKILLMPCQQSPHRTAPVASAADRAAMVMLAAATQPYLAYCDIELHRPAPSYMIDSIHTLKLLYPHESLALILGSDAYQHFTNWHQWQLILEITSLIVVNRNQDALPNTCQHPTVTFFPVTPYDISATQIRHYCHEGKNIDAWVPHAVATYIAQKKLYT